MMHDHPLQPVACITAAVDQLAVVERLNDPQDEARAQRWYHPSPLRLLEGRAYSGSAAIVN